MLIVNGGFNLGLDGCATIFLVCCFMKLGARHGIKVSYLRL